MSFISRGFRGRRRQEGAAERLPPGQYLVGGFPVLSAGPTPRTPLDRWDFAVEGEIDAPHRWTWEGFLALPAETVTKDIHCDGGYTTNLPLEDVTDGKAWIAYEYDGEPLAPEHGGPARLLVPHLYFWKSAKWVRGLELTAGDRPGFWESLGYHNYGDPWREQRYAGD